MVLCAVRSSEERRTRDTEDTSTSSAAQTRDISNDKARRTLVDLNTDDHLYTTIADHGRALVL